VPLCVELTDVVREHRDGGNVVRAQDGASRSAGTRNVGAS
jgi:hypothetical protein